jgi:YNFM family putative membrane transporter
VISAAVADHLGLAANVYFFALLNLAGAMLVGTFTYVNFVLVRPPFAVGMMTLGFVYFVFLLATAAGLSGRLRMTNKPAQAGRC